MRRNDRVRSMTGNTLNNESLFIMKRSDKIKVLIKVKIVFIVVPYAIN